MTQYRLIYYVPDPVQGARFPIAAAVAFENRIALVEVERVPGPACLGSERRAAALALIQQSIRSLDSFDRLPVGAGPHAILDAARELPVEADQAIAWIKHHVLAVDSVPTLTERRSSRHRSTYGDLFFRRWQVEKYVRRKFSPESDLNGWLARASATLEHVTHWVPGRADVFFVEPLVPDRESFEEDVRSVGTKFWGYKEAIRSLGEETKRTPKFFALVLRGGAERARDHAISALGGPCDQVIDASRDSIAQSFTERIREVALTANKQGEFGEDVF